MCTQHDLVSPIAKDRQRRTRTDCAHGAHFHHSLAVEVLLWMRLADKEGAPHSLLWPRDACGRCLSRLKPHFHNARTLAARMRAAVAWWYSGSTDSRYLRSSSRAPQSESAVVHFGVHRPRELVCGQYQCRIGTIAPGVLPHHATEAHNTQIRHAHHPVTQIDVVVDSTLAGRSAPFCHIVCAA